jgi:hypothetical protein
MAGYTHADMVHICEQLEKITDISGDKVFRYAKFVAGDDFISLNLEGLEIIDSPYDNHSIPIRKASSEDEEAKKEAFIRSEAAVILAKSEGVDDPTLPSWITPAQKSFFRSLTRNEVVSIMIKDKESRP